jgi:sulfite reductase alpha subunit-like flavoprotein
LSELSPDPVEKACLQLLCCKSEIGDRICTILCEEQKWTAIDFLQMFPSLQKTMTLTNLLSAFSPLPPRYYSVSSSCTDPVVKVAFAVVDYRTPSLLLNGMERGERRVRGLATGWLEVLASAHLAGVVGHEQQQAAAPSTGPCFVPVFPKPTADFRMPMSDDVKLVLIGPGTGIAPFVGYLRQKQQQGNSTNDSSACSSRDQNGSATIDVYFGCRHRDHDWLYQDELNGFVATGLVSNLYTAFSRDGDAANNNDGVGGGSSLRQHRYVQHLLQANADRLLVQVFDENAAIFLCGDGNAMAKDVQATLVSLFMQRLGTREESQMYLDEMKTTGRFLMDIWS